MAPRLSGLQREVLSLYRKVLREALKKDRERYQAVGGVSSAAGSSLGDRTLSFLSLLQPDSSSSATQHNKISAISSAGTASSSTAAATTTQFAAQEFEKQAKSVKKSDFKRIEYMIRKGEKHVKMLQMPGVVSVGGGVGRDDKVLATAGAGALAK